MIETTAQQQTITVITAITCDRCKERIESDDVMRFQEVQRFRFSGGYGSAFGDGNTFECDLCDKCCVKLFEPYMKEVLLGGG